MVARLRMPKPERYRVGSTISELRRAYPEFRSLTFLLQTIASLPPQEFEFVCFNNYILNATVDSIHSINFYISPARGKRLAGKYRNKKYTTTIDPNAIIVGIRPHGGCLINAISPD